MSRPPTDTAAVPLTTRSLAASIAAMKVFDSAAVTSWLPSSKPSTSVGVGMAGSRSGTVRNGSQGDAAIATAGAGPAGTSRLTTARTARTRRVAIRLDTALLQGRGQGAGRDSRQSIGEAGSGRWPLTRRGAGTHHRWRSARTGQ